MYLLPLESFEVLRYIQEYANKPQSIFFHWSNVLLDRLNLQLAWIDCAIELMALEALDGAA